MSTVGPTVDRENPARRVEVVGMFRPARPMEVAQAVAAAGRAQQEWALLPVEERVRVLSASVAALRPQLEDIAQMTCRETGKVMSDCRGEAAFALAVLEHYLGRAPHVLGQSVVDDERGRVRRRLRPWGVVAAVTPWNAPLVLTMLKVAPALVAGNAVVVKPSPLAPFGVSRLLRTMAEALPTGLLWVVVGDAEVASALVSDPGVAKVSFTGGGVAGAAVAALAAQTLRPSSLELGGNDAAILLDDVTLDDATVDRLLMAAFATSGQVCMAAKRLLVPASRHDEVVEALRASARRVLRVGDPRHDGVTMGPVVTRGAQVRVQGLVDAAVAGGARALEIGTRDEGTDLDAGHFVVPTLVLGPLPTDAVWSQEQFGPTLPLLAYDSVDQAVSLANDSTLGLTGSVWSADEERAADVAARLDVGFACVNTHNRTGLALHLPFGGVKGSGWGREYGDEGLLEYVRPTVVHTPAAFRSGGSGLPAAAYPLPSAPA